MHFHTKVFPLLPGQALSAKHLVVPVKGPHCLWWLTKRRPHPSVGHECDEKKEIENISLYFME